MTREHIKIGLLVVLSLACAFLLPTADAGKLNEGYDTGAVRLDGTRPMTGDLVLPDGTRAASRAYVASVAGDLEALLQQGSLRLYYRTATDSVTGGRILSVTPEAGAGSTIVYPALSATTYTQVNSPARVSEAGIPGVSTLTAGLYEAVRYLTSDQAVSTGRTVTGANELWLVDADGSSNPVFVATSSEYVVIGTEKTRVATKYVLTSDVSTGGTDRRFLEIHYRKRTGVLTGANPVITVYYGGTSEGIFSAPLPSEVVMRTDAANAVAATARTNLDVYSKSETASAIDADVATVAGDLAAHEVDQSTHGATVIASEARVAAHETAQDTHGCTVIASSAALSAHVDAVTGVHGAPADTRFLTASETILDAQIPAAIARDVEIPGNASFTFAGLDANPTTIAGFGITDAASVTAVQAAQSTADNHIASTGTAVHGLGTASLRGYLAGTWEPSVYGSSTAGTTASYTTKGGTYIRIGDLVYASGNVVVSALPVGWAGNVIVDGLPVAASSTVVPTFPVAHGGIDTLGGAVTGIVLGNQARFLLYESVDAGELTGIPVGSVSAPLSLYFTVVYGATN